jgi:hypothetical protein
MFETSVDFKQTTWHYIPSSLVTLFLLIRILILRSVLLLKFICVQLTCWAETEKCLMACMNVMIFHMCLVEYILEC